MPNFQATDLTNEINTRIYDMVSTYWLELLGIFAISALITLFVQMIVRMMRAGM